MTRPQWKLASSLEEAAKAFQLAVAQDQKSAGVDKAGEMDDSSSSSSDDEHGDGDDAEVDVDGDDESVSEEDENEVICQAPFTFVFTNFILG